MPYVVSHRHAAGNWAQGVLVIKKTAAAKLANLKAHAGLPGQQPGWAGEWFAFHMVSSSHILMHFCKHSRSPCGGSHAPTVALMPTVSSPMQ